MSYNTKLDRNKTAFVTDEGILTFPKLFPGQAEAPKDGGASRAYKAEHVAITISQSLADAVTYVAQMRDSQWQRHVFGPLGRLKKLEEMPGRKQEDYAYAIGKFVYNMASTITPESVEMAGANLTDPAVRAQFDAKVAAKAPQVVRYANPHIPADVAKIEEMSRARMLSGLPAYAESEYSRVQVPVLPHEIWAGCIVRIAGQAYWNKHKNTVSLGLDMVLLVREGERLVNRPSADAVFGAFAPPAELAPTGTAGKSLRDLM